MYCPSLCEPTSVPKQGPCSDVAPTAVTYAAMMKFHGNAGDADAALSVLDAMLADGISADATCWNTAISACVSVPNGCEKASAVLRRAIAAHQADVVTYNATLSVLQKAGLPAQAAALLEELCACRGSVRPNEVGVCA